MPYVAVPLGELYTAQAGEGPLAVFVHGGLLDHGIFWPQLAALSSLRRCVALDLRGFGRSSPLLADRLDDEDCAADVASAIEGLGGGPADVVGLSIGACVALSLARARPQLVRSLALLSVGLAGTDPARAEQFRASAAAAMRDGRRALGEQFATRMVAEGCDPAVVARLRSMVERTPYETILATYDRNARSADRTAELAALACPLLVAAGEHDAQIPATRLAQLAAASPAGRVEVIAGSGHLVTLEAPGEVNRLLTELWSAAC